MKRWLATSRRDDVPETPTCEQSTTAMPAAEATQKKRSAPVIRSSKAETLRNIVPGVLFPARITRDQCREAKLKICMFLSASLASFRRKRQEAFCEWPRVKQVCDERITIAFIRTLSSIEN
jgi:hypothetical protein